MTDTIDRIRAGDLGFVDEDALIAFIADRRWFAGRTAGPVGATIVRSVPVSDDPLLVSALVEVVSKTGTTEIYHLVIGVRDPDGPAESTILAHGDLDLYDALDDPRETGALIAALRASTWYGEGDAWIEFRSAVGADQLDPMPVGARPAGQEQSNTSVVYDDRLIFKWYRRLEAGVHPEIELLRFLAEREFPYTPQLLGWVEHRGHPIDATLAILQRYEAGAVDGWAFVLAGLRDGAADRLLDPITDLGRITGELHRVLASDHDDPAFVPEEVSSEGLALMSAALDELTTEVFAALPDDPECAGLAGRDDEIRARLRGAATTTGLGRKIRVHGDLHLGQALRVDDGWRVIDFEGEPARPVNERRRKRSPLRDVAGLLRSLDYAAASARRHHGADVPADWPAAARERLLTGYLQVVEPTGLLPPTGAVTDEILRLYELEKAVYELRYELAYRPGWAGIPAAAITSLLDAA